MHPFDARLCGNLLVPPISPGSLDVGKSHPLVGVIPLLRGFRTTRSTSTVVAPTSLDRRKPRQPLQLVARRACSEPCRHVPIELWVPGKHSDWHHQRASQPRNGFGNTWAAELQSQKRFTRDARASRKLRLGEAGAESATTETG